MRTVPGSGAILSPTFNSEYGVSSIQVTNGGSGYASTDPPKISIKNTVTPIEEGVFYPIIVNGSIHSISIINPGVGYYPLSAGVTATGQAFISTTGTISTIRITNAGYGYTVAPTITISAGSSVSQGNFIFGEEVSGSISNAVGIVKYWDAATSTLKVSGMGTDFVVGDLIVGEDSNATYKILSYDTYKLDSAYDESEDIEKEADGIIDFTEINPFGEV